MAISKRIEDALNQQIHNEFYSAYLYLSMSTYSDANNLPGFAQWMRIQNEEERSHGMRLFDYLEARSGRVRLGAIEQPPGEFDSPLAMFKTALEHESEVTTTIHRLYELAKEESDYPTEVELQWFVREQVEEEKTIQDILAQLRMIGDQPTALVMMDRQLGSRQTEAT